MVINHYNFAGSNKQITPKHLRYLGLNENLIHWVLSLREGRALGDIGDLPPCAPHFRGRTCVITFDEVITFNEITHADLTRLDD